MVFHEFANMLISVLAGGDNIAEHCRELVRNITDIPDDVEDNPIDNLSNSTWKKYFRGERTIKNTARKINKYIEDEKFVTYINNLSDGARDTLCTKLKFKYPEVNNFNVGEICASLFKTILEESAQNTAVNLYEKDNIKEKYELSLLIEANCICANHNCCENLYIIENGRSIINYEITVIDPSISKDSFDNLIALCHKCSKKYTLTINNENIKNMKNIKNNFIKKSNIKETLSNSKTEFGINSVIKKIQNLTHSELIGLEYKHISLDENLLKENTLLLFKNIFYIRTYYNYVHNLFKQLEEEGHLRFKIIHLQIHLIYQHLLDYNLPYPKIYEYLVEWLMNSTHEDREPCEIIISYLLHNFEKDDTSFEKRVSNT